MSMSRKDYVAVATVLADRHDKIDTHDFISVVSRGFQHAAVDEIAHELAHVFKIDNGNFDRARFLRAAKSEV